MKLFKQYHQILNTKEKRTLLLLLFFMLLTALLETLGISLLLPLVASLADLDSSFHLPLLEDFINQIPFQNTKERILFLSLLFLFIILLKNILIYAMKRRRRKFIVESCNRTLLSLYRNYISRPYEYFLSSNTSEIITVLNVYINKIFQTLQDILQVLTETIVSLFLMVFLFFIDWKAPLFIAAILILTTLFLRKTVYENSMITGKKSMSTYIQMTKIVQESVMGVKDLKLLTAENSIYRQYEEKGFENLRYEDLRLKYESLPPHIIEVVVAFSILLYLLFSLNFQTDPRNLLPEISALSLAVLRLVPAVTRINNSLSRIFYYAPIVEKIDSEVLTPAEKNNAISEEFVFSKSIDFQRVSYHYPDSEKWVLQDFSISIKRGEKIGIIGPSGEGKTTFVDLLLGLLLPQKGKITIDTLPLEECRQHWMKQIGYIPQMIFMMDASIRKNIEFYRESLSDEELWHLLKLAHLDRFVKTLPKGLDTVIGERGIRLSGGQRQRIGIARVLYDNPAILVFDEATASLDNETEREIMKEIYSLSKDKTLIMIAHRITTLKDCENIYSLEKGTLHKISKDLLF